MPQILGDKKNLTVRLGSFCHLVHSLPGHIPMSHNNDLLPAQSWALSLALYLNGLTTSDVERVSGFDVEHVTERMRAVGEEPEGILSDIRLPPDIMPLWLMSLLH